MSLLADALQPYTVRGLIALRGHFPSLTLPDVLTSNLRAGYDLDFDDTSERIRIDFRVPDVIMGAIASDSTRLASASFQTIESLSAEIRDKKTIAWAMVKLYYAAFYGGHALLRLLGESCSFFARSHVDKVSTLGMLIGKSPSFSIGIGLYHCIVNADATGFDCRKATGTAGGAHESFWGVFGPRLKMLTEGISVSGILGTTETTDVVLKLERLRALLSAPGCVPHGYLSAVRNDIQYRQRHQLWIPVGLSRRDRDVLSRIAGQWRRDPMTVNLELGAVGTLLGFAAACTFIVSLCRMLFQRIADRSSVGRQSFVHFGLHGLA